MAAQAIADHLALYERVRDGLRALPGESLLDCCWRIAWKTRGRRRRAALVIMNTGADRPHRQWQDIARADAILRGLAWPR